jgi:hypothetical protein
MQVFDFRLTAPAEFFGRTYSFWAGIFGGCFLTMASHGTDQLTVQRLLAARDCRQSQAALLASWVVIFVQFTLFLAIGTCLFVVYREQGQAAPAVLDRLYPLYIWQKLPAGVAGLVMAAILAAAMSNLSAALNSLASTTVLDLWKPLVGGFNKTGGGANDATWLARSRYATVVWGSCSWEWRCSLDSGETCCKPGFRSRPSFTDRCWACFYWDYSRGGWAKSLRCAGCRWD